MFFWNSLAIIHDLTNVGNLISGSSAYSKPSLFIWKFLVYVLLMHSLKDFEHNFASMWHEHYYTIIWTFFGIALLWDWNENWHFPVLWPCWHTECSILIASSFRILNSSTGIPSPPLALFIVILPKAHLISYSRMSDCRWVITPLWLSR